MRQRTMQLNAAEAEACRRWFNAVRDMDPLRHEAEDFALAQRLYRALGKRVPDSIARRLAAEVIENERGESRKGE